MKNTKPNILITNDDGVYAPGIQALIQVAEKFGKVTVVAPSESRSAMSHAVTINSPLYVERIFTQNGAEVYSCSGTSADCVKVALHEICLEKPDFIFSGINHGANSSISVVYSGTMGAAMEGCISNIPSAGFSVMTHDQNIDLSTATHFISQIINNIIQNGLPDHVCLNVNIPVIDQHKIKGTKICRQARSKWEEKFFRGIDENQKEFLSFIGDFINYEPDSTDTDDWALRNDYISIVPVHVDLTSHSSIHFLKNSGYEI